MQTVPCMRKAGEDTDGEQYASFPGRHTAGSEASTSYLSDEAEHPTTLPAGSRGWRGVAGALWGLLRHGNDIEGAVCAPPKKEKRTSLHALGVLHASAAAAATPLCDACRA